MSSTRISERLAELPIELSEWYAMIGAMNKKIEMPSEAEPKTAGAIMSLVS